MVKPIRTFEVWITNGRIYGREIEHKPYPRSADGFATAHVLIGKGASFCIVSNYRSIDRAIAIRFASAIAGGAFKTFNIDLTKVGKETK